MKRILYSVVALCMAACCFAETDFQKTERMILETLETPIAIEINKPIKFKSALKLITTELDIPFEIDEKSCRTMNVTPDTQVLLKIPEPIKAKSALAVLTHQLGLEYVVKDGKLKIIASPASVRAVRKEKKYSEAELETLRKLAGTFSFDTKEDISLEKALKKINEKTEVNIFLNYHALREAGVDLEKTVNFRLPFHVRGRDALDYLAKQSNFGWTVKNEILVITSKKQAHGSLYTENYFVGDLLKVETSKDSDTVQEGEHFTPLMDYLQTMVQPESWGQDSETGAEMMEYYPNRSLVVRQTEEGHADLARLLHDLRKINGLLEEEEEYLTGICEP